jgi:hypothetical protein
MTWSSALVPSTRAHRCAHKSAWQARAPRAAHSTGTSAPHADSARESDCAARLGLGLSGWALASVSERAGALGEEQQHWSGRTLLAGPAHHWHAAPRAGHRWSSALGARMASAADSEGACRYTRVPSTRRLPADHVERMEPSPWMAVVTVPAPAERTAWLDSDQDAAVRSECDKACSRTCAEDVTLRHTADTVTALLHAQCSGQGIA